MKEIVAVGAMVLLSFLLVAKSDKQIIHLLEGKLWHSNADTGLAARTYRKHTRLTAWALFAVSFAMIAVAVILFTKNNPLYLGAVLAALLFLGAGIWDRTNSFRAADRELTKH